MNQNPLRLKSIHHVEFWVGNARQAVVLLPQGFGFSQAAYAGLETGLRDQTSYLLTQGKIRFVLTTPLSPEHPAAEHLKCHGDGVRDIAFHVDDADRAFEEAVRRGASVAVEPHDLADDHGAMRHAAIHTYGDTLHSFLSYQDYRGPFLPGFVEKRVPGEDIGLLRVDHMVGNVELGRMNEWADWYNKVLGFDRFISFDDKDISTEYSALMSIVMADDSQAIKFPLNEPAPGKKKSQIDEYLEFYRGPGVQHVALLVQDIASTVTRLRDNGVEFLAGPRQLLRRPAVARRRDRRVDRHAAAARRARGPRRGRLPAAALHAARPGPPDAVLRDHRAQGQPRLRQGQLPGAVRGDRARAGAQGEPLGHAHLSAARTGATQAAHRLSGRGRAAARRRS